MSACYDDPKMCSVSCLPELCLHDRKFDRTLAIIFMLRIGMQSRRRWLLLKQWKHDQSRFHRTKRLLVLVHSHTYNLFFFHGTRIAEDQVKVTVGKRRRCFGKDEVPSEEEHALGTSARRLSAYEEAELFSVQAPNVSTGDIHHALYRLRRATCKNQFKLYGLAHPCLGPQSIRAVVARSRNNANASYLPATLLSHRTTIGINARNRTCEIMHDMSKKDGQQARYTVFEHRRLA